jgi:hypothetical protein
MHATKDLGFTATAIAFCLTLAGCNNAPPPQDKADYSQTLNRYYEGRPLCVWSDAVSFPIEDATPDQIKENGLNALVEAGLLVRKHARKGATAGSYAYDLSPEGRSALDADLDDKNTGNFCFGRRKVVAIDGARQNSRSTEIVDFHYSVEQPASWATEYPIQSAFPHVSNELSGPHKAEVTLLDTTNGWEVSGTPATIIPVTRSSHDSALARAKTAFHLGKKQSS